MDIIGNKHDTPNSQVKVGKGISWWFCVYLLGMYELQLCLFDDKQFDILYNDQLWRCTIAIRVGDGRFVYGPMVS